MDEQTDRNMEYKRAKTMAVIAFILIILAFSCLIVPAITQYNDNFHTVFLPAALVGFFRQNIAL